MSDPTDSEGNAIPDDLWGTKHPDNVKMEAESNREAEAAIDAWFDKHVNEIKRTFRTYEDGDAETYWWTLRELFWGSDPIGSDSLRAPKRR